MFIITTLYMISIIKGCIKFRIPPPIFGKLFKRIGKKGRKRGKKEEKEEKRRAEKEKRKKKGRKKRGMVGKKGK